MSINADLFSAKGDQYIGAPYTTMDCQGFIEKMLEDAGIKKNLKGSNAWYREMTWVGTPEECKKIFGAIPVGAFLFIQDNNGGEVARGYKDGLGNASHIGVYIGRKDGAIHSSQSRGCVAYSKFSGKSIRGGWNRIGLWDQLDYGDNVNKILADMKGKPGQKQEVTNMANFQKAVVTASSVNFRAQPTTSSARIGVFQNGAELKAYQYNSDWSYVEDRLGNGYVMNKFITYTDPLAVDVQPVAEQPVPQKTVATTTDLQANNQQIPNLTKQQIMNYVSAIEQLCAALRKHLT